MSKAVFRTRIFGALMVVVAGGLVIGMASQASAVELARHSAPGDLFYNEYVPPMGPGTVGAKLYPCPRPTPPLVGHTYITYQPLMPQEFLYHHYRHYTTVHDDAPRTRTSVHWR
jgi:hypothetical protein